MASKQRNTTRLLSSYGRIVAFTFNLAQRDSWQEPDFHLEKNELRHRYGVNKKKTRQFASKEAIKFFFTDIQLYLFAF